MVPFLTPFLGEGSPTKIDHREKIGNPYSNLSNVEGLVGHDPNLETFFWVV